MLFKRSDTSKNSTTTSTSAGSAGSTGCASASANAGCASASGASSAISEHCHQKAKGKKQQSKTSKDKSCNSSAMAKDRLSALIKNELQDERGPESVAERLKAVLKDSPRARAEQEAKLMESSVQSDGAEAKAGASDNSDEPKFYAPIVVYTVEELAQAQKDRAERIVVKGELAEKLKVALKGLRSIGAGSLNTLALCLSGAALLAPFTGGVSLGAAGTAMGTLGAALTATAIAAISAIGLALVIAVFKGYDEVKLGGGGVELVIKKHKDKK